jgi:hypothetical protein
MVAVRRMVGTPRWERMLDEVCGTGVKAKPAGVAPDERVAFVLSKHWRGIQITALLQKQKKGDWSRGQEISA